MTTIAAPILWTVPFAPLPSSVPETAGFWSRDGGLTDWKHREKWIAANVRGARRQRLFAVACASRCLPVFERDYLKNNRPRAAIKTAEWFAELKRPTEKNKSKLESAASVASETASSSSSSSAAAASWAASWTSWASSAASWASESASWAAAGAGAWAASSSERLSQSRVLSLLLPLSDWDTRYESDVARAIAAGMYEDRAWDRAPILADAIQDWGCEGWILDALRDPLFPDIAFRGLWIVDKLRGVV